MSTSESSDSYCVDSPPSCSSSEHISRCSEPTQRIIEGKAALPDSKSGPNIEILEQPQSHARFRYQTEGEHGYLCGKNSTKVCPTYPTVQLVNFNGGARLKCELYEFDQERKHPHQLKFNRQEDQIDFPVPNNGSYKVIFDNLSIIHTSKNIVTKELHAKYEEDHPNARIKEMKKYCKKLLNSINFNKVRLRFSAHRLQTDKEICHAYSRAILNSKSCDTKEPKIIRVTKLSGLPSGGEETTLLVEKINKDTKVRFVEYNAGDVVVWSAVAHFILVHHQLAVVCRIPAYKNPNLGQDVEVFIELFRETDGATSNRVPFKYEGRPHLALRERKRSFPLHTVSVSDNSDPEPRAKFRKSQNTDESYSGPQVCEVQVSRESWSPVVQNTHTPQQLSFQATVMPIKEHIDLKVESAGQSSDTDSGVQENGNTLPIDLEADILSFLEQPQLSEEVLFPEDDPMSRRNPALMEEDDNAILRNDLVLSQASAVACHFTARPVISQPDDWEHFNQLHQTWDTNEYNGTDGSMNEGIFFQNLIPDSAQFLRWDSDDVEMHSKEGVSIRSVQFGYSSSNIWNMDNIKELVKNIFFPMKKKYGSKLENLLHLNLPNGDTYLHRALNWPAFSVLVNMLQSINMTHLLNKANDRNETVLHLAVLHALPDVARMLTSKGCDPMLADINGNTAIHLAATSYRTLKALLDAIAADEVPHDLNATNNENQTPVHLATINDCESSLRLLLKSGADVRAHDHCGRSALHLAASHDRANIMSVLLDHTDAGDVDATDYRGQTALQVACGSDLRDNTLEIIVMLLEAKADPRKCDGDTVSSMKLAKRHSEMCKIIQRHMSRLEEPDDEYYTADEGESEDYLTSKLQAIKINEVKCC